MPWADKVAMVERNALAEFGEGVEYTYASTATQELRAIFRSAFVAIDPETEVAVTTTQPNLKVRTADMDEAPTGGEGIAGDPADTVQVRGATYRVSDVELDEANEWAVLLLHRTA